MLAEGAAEERLDIVTPLTRPGEFTRGIAGPSCNAVGHLSAVNFARQGTIGRVTPDGRGEVFVTLPDPSVGNGIVFDSKGRMYMADYVGQTILRIEPSTRAIAGEDRAAMNQPNDLAIAPDDTLSASDPNWADGTGPVWKVSPSGAVERVAAGLGTINGIEIGPPVRERCGGSRRLIARSARRGPRVSGEMSRRCGMKRSRRGVASARYPRSGYVR
jgi:hypothetical protein